MKKSIKNLDKKSIKNTQVIKGGEDGIGTGMDKKRIAAVTAY